MFTVPVGICSSLYNNIITLKPYLNVDIIANPEFLKARSAIFDVMHPDRIVIGINSNNNNLKQR